MSKTNQMSQSQLSEMAAAYNLYARIKKTGNLIPDNNADAQTLTKEFMKVFPKVNDIDLKMMSDIHNLIGLDDQIKETIKNLMSKYDIKGVIWKLCKNGVILSRQAIGEVLQGVPITSDMYFRIGSCTKSFTTTMILILVDKGFLSITDTVNKWFPKVIHGDKITLEMLANMTSGIRSYSADEKFVKDLKQFIYKYWTEEELINIGLKDGPECEPGKCWRYCNTNTVMLGMIASKVTNKSYEDLLKELILDPLGMSNTIYPLTPDLPIPFVHGYSDFRNEFYDQSTFWNPSWARGAGAIVSNIDDLLTWAEAVGKGSLLSDASKKAQLRNKVSHLPSFNESNYYGMGVGVRENGWITHAGNIPGYNSCFAYYPAVPEWSQKRDLSLSSNRELPTYDNNHKSQYPVTSEWDRGLSFAVVANKSSEDISNYADIILDEINRIVKSRFL